MIKKIAGFFASVKEEVGKVVWPTRRETVSASLMIFIFSVVAAAFFLLVDQIFVWILGFAFNI
ncbi:MAG: preprotein translocase subunit SecE [Rickettsiales bacterium]|jgi:preprotein translocase subunit SecE|nr:preprotein translocase subunit SecE [Rickettsiales bacterium]